MVTIYDVAKKAGVSPATVSRVINNNANVTPETRQKVIKVCKKLNYVPNSNASSLRKKNTKTLALIIPDIQNPFFTSVLKGFEDKASKMGYTTIVCNTDENSRKEHKYINVIIAKRIDGVAISTVSKSSDHLKEIINRGIPFILIDRKIDDLDVDIVCGDSYSGAIKLIDHLIKLGHKKIAMISAPLHLSTSRERLEGYKEALKRSGIEPNPDFIMIDKKNEGFSSEGAFEMALELLMRETLPTAIFAANNLMALGVYKALKQKGYEVPGDIALVTFDDLSTIYNLDQFLTIMKQPANTMGRMSAEILVNRIEDNYENNKQKLIMQPELIIRKSCGANIDD